MAHQRAQTRRMIRTWASDTTHLTHYDPSGRTLLLCAQCLLDPDPDAVLNQAITVWNGTALCEWHLYPERSQPGLDVCTARQMGEVANGH